MIESLWGDDFAVKEDDVKQIIAKVKKPKVVKEVSSEKKLKSKVVSIEDKMKIIEEDVHRILGKFEEDTVVIKSYNELVKYIDKAIENKIIAIDTETNNSLNTFDCLLMGLCIYTPGMKAAYVPVNHVDRETNIKLAWQVTEAQIGEQLQRIVDNNVFEIYHNATFDIEVLNQTCGVRLKADWDTLSGAQILDENELKGLKIQYKLHCNPEAEKYDIEHLFMSLPYEIFDPDLFALYAATDARKTHDLWCWQKEQFEKPENKDIYTLFKEIEVPILDTIVNMELAGVEIDTQYASKMSVIYHERSDEVQSRIDAELANLEPIIAAWKLSPEANAPQKKKDGSMGGKSKVQQLSNPIELSSPTQMAILLYDILKVPVIDKKMPRGTGADILEALAPKYKICSLLLEKREVDILINTFIDKIPEFVQKDGRVHARFNSCGTQTGRFSSTSPNLTQIPSHDKVIRMMFVPSKGNVLCGADFSGQEVRVLASASNDKGMIDAYAANKDLYAMIGSLAFHTSYENCLEFNPTTHELSPEGKARRSNAKLLLLGLNYGMSTHSLAERLNCSEQEAASIIEEFYKGFQGVKKYTEDSQEMLKKLGYVTDIFGRRRHIPDAQLPDFEVIPNQNYSNNFEFNPLLDSVKHEDKNLQLKIATYKEKLLKLKWKKDIDALSQQAEKEGLIIKNNKGFKSRAMRQCLNARIQGSSASMTKKAMIMIDNDEQMKSFGAKLLVTIHDEVFCECPAEFADQVAKRLCDLMVEAAKIKCGNVAWKVDAYVVSDGWYEDEACGNILNDFKKKLEKISDAAALKELYKKYSVFNKESIEAVCNGSYTPGVDSLKYGLKYYKD